MTAKVSPPLQTERLPDGRRKLLRDIQVEVDGLEIWIPAGFDTDYSSIPWFGRGLIPFHRADVAGVAHDWLYRKGGKYSDDAPPLPRFECDRIWRIVARSGLHSCNAVQAWIGWAALVVGGWYAWRVRRKEREAGF